MGDTIEFLLNDEPRSLSNVSPTLTVLNYLRRHERLTGTKEGCAEGDCGACTLILAEPDGDSLVYRPVNSCIQFVPALHGRQLISVEHLSDGTGGLHPVQQALVDLHGSQCGFCTPGFVMQLYAGWKMGAFSDRQGVKDWLAGNLCRCTGYGPIIDAGESLLSLPNEPDLSDQETANMLRDLAGGEMLALSHDGQSWYSPRTTQELASVYADHPNATLIAGATDVGLWVTKLHRELDVMIDVTRIDDLQNLTQSDNGVIIGAAVTHEQAIGALASIHRDIGEMMRRFAGVQIRTAGTVGGNIANGSPIGDLPPVLIALDAKLVLRRGEMQREISIEDYFIEYGLQDRKPGEFLEEIRIPPLAPDTKFSCFKISKRFDQDISAVMAAFSVELNDEKIVAARIAFGGMAGTPKRAPAAEAALIGAILDDNAVDAACEAIASDFTPLTDMRASADYRLLVAQNCLRRFFIEISGEAAMPTRILESAHE